MIESLLWASIALPFVTAFGLFVGQISHERAVARLALGGSALSALAALAAIVAWLAQHARPIQTPVHIPFSHASYRFTLTLVLDGAAAVFLTLVQFITSMVMRFSRFYLHREPGFRRFFVIVLLFQAAMCLLTLAGNLDLMFAGWELVGISSFLLIAFYRERQSAVRNALKTYSVYRVADIGMLLAACLQGAGDHSGYTLGLLVLLAAMGKSAQFPFSFWIARAMEGPTPSSALFYGALSVHAGAYLLLRTFPLFGGVLVVRIAIGIIGLVTALSCSMFSGVQPTIKGQIGYASAAQVGLIFVEIALGLTHLALLHIVSNALLRCYQLLVSPSVVAHRLRRQATAGAARASAGRSFYGRLVPERWWPTLYAFALSEGYLKDFLKIGLWFPLRRLGDALQRWRLFVVVAGAGGVVTEIVVARDASTGVATGVATALVVVAIACSACGLGMWRRPARAILWISGSNLLVVAAASLSPGDAGLASGFYACGLAAACALGFTGFAVGAPSGSVARFAGRWDARPKAAFVAFAGSTGIAGVPLWPTFWGEDLVVHATLGASRALSVAVATLIAANGYLAVRNFAYAFMGRGDVRSS